MTIRWGLIGAGDIVRKRVAAALREVPNSKLGAICRRDARQAEAAAKELGAARWFADWHELVADDAIDAVYVATPVHVHAEQTIAAAVAGKHVLCEKPMALSAKECDAMIAACRSNNVKLGIAYYRRFYPVIARVKKIVESGEIGIISVAQINAFEYFDPPLDDPRRWLLDRAKSGGGPMMDFGCHRLEVLNNLFGKVRSVESLVSDSVFGRVVEDMAAALLRFENGRSAVLTVTHAAIEPQDTLDIYGTKGSIHIPVLNTGEMTIRAGTDVRREEHPPAANVHEPLIDDFTRAVLSDRAPEVDGETGREVSLLVEKIYRGKDDLAAGYNN